MEKDYRSLISNKLREIVSAEVGKNVRDYNDLRMKACDIISHALTIRFERDLAESNDDMERVYSKENIKKNLEYVRVYVNDFYIFDENSDDVTLHEISVRKEMKKIIIELYEVFN